MYHKSHDLWQLDATLIICLIASFPDLIKKIGIGLSEATCINNHAFSKMSPAVFHSTPLTLFSVDLSKAVIAHFIHEAVQEYG